MKISPYAVALLASLPVVFSASAQVISEGHIRYSIGELDLRETPTSIAVFDKNGLVVTAKIVPGGELRPRIGLDEMGMMRVGGLEIDVRTGSRSKDSRKRSCRPPTGVESLAEAENQGTTLILAARPGRDGRRTEHQILDLSRPHCKERARANIAPKDVDDFFEFQGNSNGWWLLGSQIPTVLLSKNGRQWKLATLPSNIHVVRSALWVTPRDFWMLANKYHDSDLSLVLLRSSDMGESWEEVEATERNIPGYWFQAIRELAADAQH